MAYNYRCSIKRLCGKRITLLRLIEHYIHRPKCPSCGRDTLKFDQSPRNQTILRTCRCGGIHYPHKKGLYLNRNEFCEHADVDLDDRLHFKGAHVTRMHPNDEVPF